jgi:microcystin degradation protein MlrC
MLAAAEELGATVIPTFHGYATPSGTIAKDAFAAMLSELLAGIRAALPVDAVALALHGAGVLLPTSTTNLDPARAVNALCADLERQPGVIDCTFFHGFPYTDIPQVGAPACPRTDGR